MNKKVLLILFLVIGLSSCSLLKSSNKNSILGKWKFQSEVTNGKIKAIETEEYFQFFNEGTMIHIEVWKRSESEKIIKGNYTVQKDKLTLINKKNGKEHTLDYEVNGDTLILTFTNNDKAIFKRVK